MRNNIKEIIIWTIVCLTALGLGAELLVSTTHLSDNTVRIETIRKEK